MRRVLDDARAATDALFEVLRPDCWYDRPIPERHRSIFYLGHVEAFDWNLLSGPLGLEPFQPGFDRLFAFGIDPREGDLPDDTASDWPAVAEVRAYNRQLRDRIDAALERAPAELLHVAIEHRLMHAETFAYMLHNLPHGKKCGLGQELLTHGAAPETRYVEIPAGEARLGMDPAEGFGWDNEFRAHSVRVPAFAIAKHKVTNGDYLEFVREGAAPPHFWIERDGQWYWRGMFAEVPLPLDWPVWVTHREASAYAAWKGKALPSEAQWQRAAYAGTAPRAGNFDFARWDPVPVDEAPNALGVSQMAGNGWEWTSTVFHPFAGFEPFEFYPNYSAPFFDGCHYVLKGASPRTAACFLRPSFRNWFRPAYPYVYAGFRLVEN